MISVRKARRLILQNARSLPPALVPLSQGLGLVLAGDVRSPSDYPLYDVSAMDGYALKASDTSSAAKAGPLSLKIRGTRHAGDPPQGLLKPGECFRVMTGCVVPAGADSVLERELVAEKGGFALIRQAVPRGRNVRFRGGGVRKGSLALRRGARLHSRAVGFLAGLGLASVRVHPRPKAALIVTGNELVTPGGEIRPGRIYNSNRWMLEAALNEQGIRPAPSLSVPDRPQRLKGGLKEALDACDLVLLAGGVSVGDSDFSKPVLESLGVRRVFWRVGQKPGFPLYFGKRGRTLVFGLPGNPASAWINFHEYVVPALRALEGLPSRIRKREAGLDSRDIRQGRRTLFLKGRLHTGKGKFSVKVLEGQASHLLKSLAEGDCLVVVPPGNKTLKKGAVVEVHPLPGEEP